MTSVRSSEDPARSGDAVTFTATVSAAQPDAGTPTGSVQFQIDGALAGSSITLVDGVASFTTTALSNGNHAVTAIYTSENPSFASGSGSLAGGQSVSAPAVVNVTTTTTLSSNVSTAVFGQAVTFTAVVCAQGAGSLAPTGSVSFVHGLTVLGSVSLSGGVAQFATTNLALGSHPIHAVYEGGGNFTGSHSGMVSLSVQPDAATVVVSPSANPSPPKASLKLAVTVGAAAPGSGTPTGSVTFYDGKKALGTASLSGGVASLSTKKLKMGSHTITVIYRGDADFTGSTSATLHESIKKAAKSKKAKPRIQLVYRSDPRAAHGTTMPANNRVASTRLQDLALEAFGGG